MGEGVYTTGVEGAYERFLEGPALDYLEERGWDLDVIWEAILDRAPKSWTWSGAKNYLDAYQPPPQTELPEECRLLAWNGELALVVQDSKPAFIALIPRPDADAPSLARVTLKRTKWLSRTLHGLPGVLVSFRSSSWSRAQELA
jgi:hypothetical protein